LRIADNQLRRSALHILEMKPKWLDLIWHTKTMDEVDQHFTARESPNNRLQVRFFQLAAIFVM
jgi:hypothetical protein